MKALAAILAVALVAGCSGMRPSSSSGTSSNPSGNSSDYLNWQNNNSSGGNRHDDPRDLYFGS